jgi:hypothetical protein
MLNRQLQDLQQQAASQKEAIQLEHQKELEQRCVQNQILEEKVKGLELEVTNMRKTHVSRNCSLFVH